MTERREWRAVCDDGDVFTRERREDAERAAKNHSRLITGYDAIIGFRLEFRPFELRPDGPWTAEGVKESA